MKLKEIKYSIIRDGQAFWIAKTSYILGISWSYSLIGQETMWSDDMGFFTLSSAENKLKAINAEQLNK